MRTRLTIFVLIVVVSALAGCSRGSDDEDAGLSSSTETTSEVSEPITSAPPTTLTTTTEPLPEIDLGSVRWVVNDFDGLVDDQGRVLVPPPPIGTSAQPSVARAIDGSLYFVVDEEVVWRWPTDAGRPSEVELDWGDVPEPDWIHGLAHTDTGQVMVNPHGEKLIVDNAEPGRRERWFPDPEDRSQLGAHSFTAANGVTVEVLPISGQFDPEGGFFRDIDEPARIQVSDADGEVVWTVTAGGLGAPWLDIVDFDGRFVMLSRAPGEPADPMIEHIVYDLDCPDSARCTESFWARWGRASLVGVDREPGDDNLNPQLLDLCPIMGQVVATPAEMTDPLSFDEGFGDRHRAAFERASLALSLCDLWTLSTFGADGLVYDPDAGEDGWLWTEFAAAMRGPVRFVEGEGWIWSIHPDRAAVVMTGEVDPPFVRFQPPKARKPDNIAVVLGPEHLLITGQVDMAVAENLRVAGAIVADRRDVELVDNLTIGGARHPAASLNDLLETMANELPISQAAGEIQLTDEGVVLSTVFTINPVPPERDLGFAIADFASGGEGVFDELPLADEVLLALGTEVRASRSRLELSNREGWNVNATEFNGYSGPFNLLDRVPSPSAVFVGPQARCTSPIPVPAPPELAHYRRITIVPAEDSIDSCLDWAAVDLFVDEERVIHGIRLDLTGP